MANQGSRMGIHENAPGSMSAIVKAYGRPEIRPLSLPQSRGECSVNAGIEEARVEFGAFLDADDEWRPTKLHQRIAILETNSKATIHGCGNFGIGRLIPTPGR